MKKIPSRIFEIGMHLLFKTWVPLECEGKEHLPTKPCLIVANHCSHIDTPSLMHASGRRFDQFTVCAARDYFFKPSKPATLFRLSFHLLPIDRGASKSGVEQMINGGKEHAQAGRSLIIYPEGTRSVDGNMNQFKRGVGILALQLKLPIIPAHISGSHHVFARDNIFPRYGKIKVKFGEQIDMTDPTNAITNSRQLVALLEERVRSLGQAST